MLNSCLHRVTSIEINQDIREPDDPGIIEILITSEYSDKPVEFILFLNGDTKDIWVRRNLTYTGHMERENLMKITCEDDDE